VRCQRPAEATACPRSRGRRRSARRRVRDWSDPGWLRRGLCGARICLPRCKQPPHKFGEQRRWHTLRQTRPLHREESIGHVGVALRCVVNADGNKECALTPYQVRTLLGEVPFEAEVALRPSLRARRNDRHKERTIVDLPPDLLIPNVPAPQLALIEKDLDSGGSQSLANLLGRLRILGCVAQKYRVRGLSHRQDHPWGGLFIASVAGSLAEVAKSGRAGLPAEGQSVRIDRRCGQCPLHYS